MAARPLDVAEDQLIELMAKGVQSGVLSPRFLARLLVAVAS